MRASLLSYRNLKSKKQDKELWSITEHNLYSDSRFTDQVSNGETYSFINMVPPISSSPIVSPALTVRAKWFAHLSEFEHVGTESHSEDFHGGWFNDEIAALSSLKLGVRFHAGSSIRTFDYSTPEFGRPQAESSPPPIINISKSRLIVPSAFKNINCKALDELNNLSNMSEDNFKALIKAARGYQNALWICETSPHLAWLLLVSSLETAAQQWYRSKTTPVDSFKQSKPELFKILNTEEYKKLIPIIANEISPTLGVTKKFRDFCLNFLPKEPDTRPVFERIRWNKQSLRQIFDTVYKHRSKALHGGQPFPEPMCIAPDNHSGLSEVGVSGLKTTLGGTWSAKDAPVTLNTFNHMTHSILNQWWLSLYDDS